MEPEEIIDHDNDTRFKTPRAWRNAKKAFGPQERIADMMRMLENLTIHPRLYLAVALHAFLTASVQERQDMQGRFFDWMDVNNGYGRTLNRLMDAPKSNATFDADPEDETDRGDDWKQPA